MITKEPATVYRVGRRRYLSLRGAIRAEARRIAYTEMPDDIEDNWVEVMNRATEIEKDLRAKHRSRSIPATDATV